MGLLIIAIFIVFSLWFGIYHGRGVNNFRKYAIGDKKYHTAIVVATIVATHFGGGFIFGGLENAYKKGLYFAFPGILSVTSLLIIGCVFSFRTGEFLNHLSIAESMGSLYGNKVRVMTAISGILRSTIGVAMEFHVIARILLIFCPIPRGIAITIAALIVILYTVFGGIRSVTFTDVVQFVTFSTTIPVII